MYGFVFEGGSFSLRFWVTESPRPARIQVVALQGRTGRLNQKRLSKLGICGLHLLAWSLFVVGYFPDFPIQSWRFDGLKRDRSWTFCALVLPTFQERIKMFQTESGSTVAPFAENTHC